MLVTHYGYGYGYGGSMGTFRNLLKMLWRWLSPARLSIYKHGILTEHLEHCHSVLRAKFVLARPLVLSNCVALCSKMVEERNRLIVALVNELFSSDSSSDDDDETEEHYLLLSTRASEERLPRIQNYFEDVVPQYSPRAFREHFRLNPSTFEYVLGRIALEISNSANDGRPTIPPAKQLLLALWYFATPDSYRSVVDRFDVGRATALRTVRRVTAALFRLAPEIIVWPTGARVAEVTAGFKDVNGFPGIIGAVDGSHIPIPAPNINAQSYYNRKGFHSIVLQAVCDHQGMFTHCYAGEVGSVHDARVFRLSELQAYITDQKEVKFPNNTHLVGDPAYVCQPQLMVPFKDNGHLTLRQRNYNYCQSSSRCIVERAFAQVKGRLRCLKFLDMSDVDEVPKVIIACCVLHNICMSQGDDASEYVPPDYNGDDPDYNCDAGCHGEDDVVRVRSGNIKRNELAEMLPIKIGGR